MALGYRYWTTFFCVFACLLLSSCSVRANTHLFSPKSLNRKFWSQIKEDYPREASDVEKKVARAGAGGKDLLKLNMNVYDVEYLSPSHIGVRAMASSLEEWKTLYEAWKDDATNPKPDFYYDWLERTKYRTAHKTALETIYMDAAARKPFEVDFDGSHAMIYKNVPSSPKIEDAVKGNPDPYKDATETLFVLSSDKKLYTRRKKSPNIQHSSICAGLPVRSAGKFRMNKDSTIQYVYFESGHYAPDADAIGRMVEYLHSKGVPSASYLLRPHKVLVDLEQVKCGMAKCHETCTFMGRKFPSQCERVGCSKVQCQKGKQSEPEEQDDGGKSLVGYNVKLTGTPTPTKVYRVIKHNDAPVEFVAVTKEVYAPSNVKVCPLDMEKDLKTQQPDPREKCKFVPFHGPVRKEIEAESAETYSTGDLRIYLLDNPPQLPGSTKWNGRVSLEGYNVELQMYHAGTSLWTKQADIWRVIKHKYAAYVKDDRDGSLSTTRNVRVCKLEGPVQDIGSDKKPRTAHCKWIHFVPLKVQFYMTLSRKNAPLIDESVDFEPSSFVPHDALNGDGDVPTKEEEEEEVAHVPVVRTGTYVCPHVFDASTTRADLKRILIEAKAKSPRGQCKLLNYFRVKNNHNTVPAARFSADFRRQGQETCTYEATSGDRSVTALKGSLAMSIDEVMNELRFATSGPAFRSPHFARSFCFEQCEDSPAYECKKSTTVVTQCCGHFFRKMPPPQGVKPNTWFDPTEELSEIGTKRFYQQQEYLSGGTLGQNGGAFQDSIAKKPLVAKEKASIAFQILYALHALKSEFDLHHNDLNGDNIMFADRRTHASPEWESSDDGLCYIVDDQVYVAPWVNEFYVKLIDLGSAHRNEGGRVDKKQFHGNTGLLAVLGVGPASGEANKFSSSHDRTVVTLATAIAGGAFEVLKTRRADVQDVFGPYTKGRQRCFSVDKSGTYLADAKRKLIVGDDSIPVPSDPYHLERLVDLVQGSKSIFDKGFTGDTPAWVLPLQGATTALERRRIFLAQKEAPHLPSVQQPIMEHNLLRFNRDRTKP